MCLFSVAENKIGPWEDHSFAGEMRDQENDNKGGWREDWKRLRG
jgi:hypothetical protein